MEAPDPQIEVPEHGKLFKGVMGCPKNRFFAQKRSEMSRSENKYHQIIVALAKAEILVVLWPNPCFKREYDSDLTFYR